VEYHANGGGGMACEQAHIWPAEHRRQLDSPAQQQEQGASSNSELSGTGLLLNYAPVIHSPVSM